MTTQDIITDLCQPYSSRKWPEVTTVAANKGVRVLQAIGFDQKFLEVPQIEAECEGGLYFYWLDKGSIALSFCKRVGYIHIQHDGELFLGLKDYTGKPSGIIVKCKYEKIEPTDEAVKNAVAEITAFLDNV